MKLEVSKKFIDELSQVANEPEWLVEHRQKSLQIFKKMPIEKNNIFQKYVEDEEKFDFKKIDKDFKMILKDETQDDFDMDNSIITTSDGIKNNFKPHERGHVFTDIFSATNSMIQAKDIFLNTKIDDKMEAFNNAFLNSGVFIYVPIKTEVTIPLRSIFILNRDNTPMFNRTIIFVDEGSSLNFVQEAYSNNSKSSLYSEHLEVFVKENSKANLTFIQNTDNESENMINRKIFSKGICSTFSVNLGGRYTRYNIESFLNHDGAEANNNDIFFGSGEQKLDMFSRLVHMAPNTRGRVTSKAILRDKSQAIFKGMIKILKEAKNTQAYLSDHSIMMSKDAKSNSVPSLEIETDSVRATHSASTQQLDSDQIFYLTSRGLTEEEAKKTIAFGFFEPFFKQISSKSMRKCVESMMEDKWENTPGTLKISDMSDVIPKSVEEENIFKDHYKYR